MPERVCSLQITGSHGAEVQTCVRTCLPACLRGGEGEDKSYAKLTEHCMDKCSSVRSCCRRTWAWASQHATRACGVQGLLQVLSGLCIQLKQPCTQG